MVLIAKVVYLGLREIEPYNYLTSFYKTVSLLEAIL
jgi:hypothetical protein